jgi:serine/threonine-protein kinase
MIGERLGKWVIYKELGRGGMGRVYLAQEEIGGRQAALKILAGELAQDAGFLQRFLREIETLSLLEHANIVRFLEAGNENGVYFYAMEYVEGQSLDEAIHEKGKLPWKDVLDIGIQVCHALKHVHDHGVIHRDIKPQNLLLTPAGQVKVTDFGIAKLFASTHLTSTGGVVGTAEFLSPEQAAGKPVSKRSDLYSLGVVLYTCLTGRTPFEGPTYLDLLHKHRYAQCDRPQKVVPDLPYEIDELVSQLLEKDPAKRPPDSLVLGRQLEALRRKLERKSSLTQAGTLMEATVAENNRLPEPGEGHGPGPATVMSRLMREELERQNRAGPVSRLLNRWWVLLPLLLLIVGVIVWSLWPPSADALYEHGSELMKSKDPADWDRAWRDYFQPLNERYPDHPYKEQVEKYRLQIEAARDGAPEPGVSEGQRLYEEGQRLAKAGRTKEALQLWERLGVAFRDVESEKEWVQQAQKARRELEKSAAARQWASVREALKRVAVLPPDEAIKRLDAIERLYADDPFAADVLNEVRAARKRLQAQAP